MSSLYHPVKIGSLSLDGNLFLAPVAGYSDKSFRSVCREFGADFAYTEMVSAEALTRGSDKTEAIMSRGHNEDKYAVQVFGGVPETVAKASRMILEQTHCECIDINGGCPVPKIIKSGAGSSLTRDPELLYKIVKAVAEEVGGEVPVTVKFRTGWDEEHITFLDCADAAIKAGASAVTLHGRTKAQGYEGKARWDRIRQLVEFVAGRIPVFGNGDAFTPEDAKVMLEQTGCDGVMFARGAMGNPFLFAKTREFLTKGTVTEIPVNLRISAGFKELEMLVADRGEEAACREMRKRFCAYSKGIEGGGALRKVIVSANTVSDYQTIFRDFGIN